MPAGGVAVVADFTRIISDEITNTVIVMSSPEDFETIKKTIEKIDVVPRQVIVEGMVASVSLTDNLSFGLAGLFKGNLFGLDAKFILSPGILDVASDPSEYSGSGFTFVGIDTSGRK